MFHEGDSAGILSRFLIGRSEPIEEAKKKPTGKESNRKCFLKEDKPMDNLKEELKK